MGPGPRRQLSRQPESAGQRSNNGGFRTTFGPTGPSGTCAETIGAIVVPLPALVELRTLTHREWHRKVMRGHPRATHATFQRHRVMGDVGAVRHEVPCGEDGHCRPPTKGEE